MNKFSDFEKIMQVLDAKGISQSKAESLLGLGVGTIGKMKKRKKGSGSLHDDNTEKFLRIFMVNPDWWKTAEGEMFLKEPPSAKTVGTLTMDREIWGVIKLCAETQKLTSEILGLEFKNLWDHIHDLTPGKPVKTAENINGDKNKKI